MEMNSVLVWCLYLSQPVWLTPAQRTTPNSPSCCSLFFSDSSFFRCSSFLLNFSSHSFACFLKCSIQTSLESYSKCNTHPRPLIRLVLITCYTVECHCMGVGLPSSTERSSLIFLSFEVRQKILSSYCCNVPACNWCTARVYIVWQEVVSS